MLATAVAKAAADLAAASVVRVRLGVLPPGASEVGLELEGEDGGSARCVSLFWVDADAYPDTAVRQERRGRRGCALRRRRGVRGAGAAAGRRSAAGRGPTPRVLVPLQAVANTDDPLLADAIAATMGDAFDERAPVAAVVRAVAAAARSPLPPGVLDDEDAGRPSFDDEDMEDDALEVSILRAKARWEAAERAVVERAAGGAGGAPDPSSAPHMTAEERVAASRQLFSPAEAWDRLARDLADVSRGAHPGVSATAVADSVWEWDVSLSFSDGSPLASDLRALARSRDGGPATVDLRLRFARGLHPFMPPALCLGRPRLQGPAAGALAAHPALRLSGWSPWRPTGDLLAALRDWLSGAARVDASCPSNGVPLAAGGAHTPLDAALARVEALSGVTAAAAADWPSLYSLEREAAVDSAAVAALAPRKKAKQGEGASPLARSTVWAAGVGYGTGARGGEVWDAAAAAAAQEAADAALAEAVASTAAALAATPAGDAAAAAAATVVTDSALLPLLERDLGKASFGGLAARGAYARGLLSAAGACLRSPIVDSLPLAGPRGLAFPSGIAGALSGLARHAAWAQRVMEGGSGGRGAASRAATARAARTVEDEATEADADVAREVAAVPAAAVAAAAAMTARAPARRAAAPAPAPAGRRVTRGVAAAAAAAPAPAPPAPSPVLERVTEVEGVADGHPHAALARAEGASGGPRARLVRLARELASLPSDLPPGVWVAVDPGCVTLWRVLIAGPAGTPYAHGLFEFGVYAPPAYPSAPPQVLVRREERGGGRGGSGREEGPTHPVSFTAPDHGRRPLQPQPVRLRQSVPLPAGHLGRGPGRGVDRGHVDDAASRALDSSPHPRGDPVLQRAGLRVGGGGGAGGKGGGGVHAARAR